LNDFLGYDVKFCQENESKSSYGVLRGLHYQEPPFAQAKLVRVIKGSVLDIAVDIRKDSPTFGKHISIVLNDQNKKQLFIPRGFAHGFITLSDYAIFSYKILGINWKISSNNIILSKKDEKQPLFESYFTIND
jgi:dTDP-4-dehydrorhamnose 3,5-epimerase